MVSPADCLKRLVRPNDTVLVGNGTAEPSILIEALLASKHDLPGNVRVIQITTSGQERLAEASGGRIRLATPSPGAKSRRAIQEGRADLIPASLGQIAGWIDRGEMKVDGVLLQLGPTDGDEAWPGLTMDLAMPAFERARYRLVETNPALPRICSSKRFSISACDLVVESHSPPSGDAARKDVAGQGAIAANLAACIPPEATLEVGIGRIAALLPEALAGRSGIALHTGIIGDEARALVEAGIVNRPVDSDDPAAIVTSVIRGGPDLYRWCDRNPLVRLADARVTHNPIRLARQPRFVAVNAALQVDLFGNANSLMIDGKLLGGIGGANDYAVAGSYASGSVIVLAAAHGGRSTIVPRVERVTLSGNFVTHVVTEHGVADLRGCSFPERARRMVEVADPRFRESLNSFAGSGPHW